MAAPASAQVQPVFMMEHAGLDSMLVDDHDAALARALAQLPSRVSELPNEIPDMPPELAAFVQSVLGAVAQPMRMGLIYNGDNPAGGAMGYGLVVSIEARDEAHAREIEGLVDHLLSIEPPPFDIEPSDRFDGMKQMMHPMALMSFGPRKADGDWRYEFHIGSIDEPDFGFDTMPESAPGVDQIFSARVDLAGLTPGINYARMMAANEVPQAGAVTDKLHEAGLLGENAVRADVTVGYTRSVMVSDTTIRNARTLWEFLRLPSDTIPVEDINAIPRDVLFAAQARFDFQFINALMDHAADLGAPMEMAERQFTDATGLDLRDDILNTLGGTFGMYTSLETGGGSLLSSVLMLELRDRDRFLHAHQRLKDMANQAAAQIPVAGHYTRLETWARAGQDFVSLRFNGLPVPLELTYAVAGKWLIVAPTPQAAIVAVDQTHGKGGPDLSTNPRFSANVPAAQGLYSFTFTDPEQTFRNGYPTTTLLGSAIANAMRSPAGRDFEPGVIVPTYAVLAEDATPLVQYSSWNDDALYMRSMGDRSWLVNMATKFGAGGGGGGLGGLMQGLGAAQQMNSSLDGPHGLPVDAWPIVMHNPLGVPGMAAAIMLLDDATIEQE